MVTKIQDSLVKRAGISKKQHTFFIFIAFCALFDMYIGVFCCNLKSQIAERQKSLGWCQTWVNYVQYSLQQISISLKYLILWLTTSL